MSISYEYNPDSGYVLARVTKLITLQEVISYVDSILEDNKINKPFYELVDFADIDDFDFGYYQSDQLYNKLILLKEHKQHLGTCFVASKDIAKGMSNIFKVAGEQRGMNIQIFNKMDDALKYIKNNYLTAVSKI